MEKHKLLAIANLIAFVIANVISYLSNTKFFFNTTIAEVSAQYPALFVPAGFTFSIWGVIYLGLYVFTISHLIFAYKKPTDHAYNKELKTIGWWFVWNNLATAAWVLVWLNEMLIVSVLLIVFQLITLIVINLKLRNNFVINLGNSHWFTRTPLTIYWAWICIATIANISSSLLGLGYTGEPLSATLWTIILIVIAGLLCFYVIYKIQNIAFGLVIIWALYGIISKLKQLEANSYQIVITTAWLVITLIAIQIIYTATMGKKKSLNREF